MKTYYVYFMASLSGALYIGVTNDLKRRVFEHKEGSANGFSKKYKCSLLVYFEETSDVLVAIEREKQLKRWRREKKEQLIDRLNPRRIDLSDAW
ncbi:MAG: GIY-YIG nuclease family protein [Candidatus Uhrbacteria bacterium]|nr:GIY-YIG nuclease family protein [Candidatus Uhrbacteria bacterium]